MTLTHRFSRPFALLIFLVTGCASASLSTAPSFEQVSALWEAPRPGTGRVVVYTAPGGTLARAKMELDGASRVYLDRSVFFYADVPEGSHEVSYGALVGGELEFEVRAGETLYVEIDWPHDPTTVPEALALPRLKDHRSGTGDALPFNL